MYVLHFYTATHHEGLRDELKSAVSAGLPVFISECGICEASGDGRIDFASAAEWFSYLNGNKISYAIWSLSDKDESSAFFKPGFDPFIKESIGIVRIILKFETAQLISQLILLFWIFRNLYFLIMSLFLVDGRDCDEETVKVTDAEQVKIRTDTNQTFEGITTFLTEHNLTVFLDENPVLTPGTSIEATVFNDDYIIDLKGVVTSIRKSSHHSVMTYTIEILDFNDAKMEYWQLLYDRIPTLPQSLHRDFGVFMHLWQNIAYRVARTRK